MFKKPDPNFRRKSTELENRVWRIVGATLTTKKSRLENNLLVVGSGRSGTTWLAELLNYSMEYRIVFEPFSPLAIHYRVGKGAGKGRYYVPVEGNFKYKDRIREYLLGHVSNPWVNRVEKSNRWSKRIMVKAVRLNTMLGWLQRNFPELKIILIVRDPYSVAYSFAERKWNNVAGRYTSQANLMSNNFSREQIDLLQSPKGFFQEGIVVWAIETFVPLKEVVRGKNVSSIFYEALVSDPKHELHRLAKFANHTFSEDVLDTLGVKSTTAGNRSVVDKNSKAFAKRWQGNISKEDQKYAEKVLKSLGLDKLYKGRNNPAFKQPLDLQF